MLKNLFIFGLGYTGCALARAAIALGYQVVGTARAPMSAAISGLDIIRYSDEKAVEAALGAATHVISTVPPVSDGVVAGDPVLARYGKMLARQSALSPLWVGYLSATSVYGDADGGVVTETTEPAPGTKRGASRLMAERTWLSLLPQTEIFRLSGIYGPGRNVVDQLKNRTARRIVKPGHVMNRIHIDDIVGALLAAIDLPSPGAIYNVSDDEPAPTSDVITYAAQLLNLVPPMLENFADATLSPALAEFYAENKRVSNDKLKTVLGYHLKHGTYRRGISALVSSGQA